MSEWTGSQALPLATGTSHYVPFSISTSLFPDMYGYISSIYKADCESWTSATVVRKEFCSIYINVSLVSAVWRAVIIQMEGWEISDFHY